MDADPARCPLRVLPASADWPLHDVAASRRIEAHELARHPAGALMQMAGLGVARLALALAPHGRTVWIAVGPGGNGGDGLHAAAELQQRGRQVSVTLCADAARLPADANAGLRRAQAAGVTITHELPPAPPDLSIDALLGIGASRPPEGLLAAAISALNSLAVPCLAIDVPSGLGADTGTPLGPVAVRATATLSLLTLKPGLFTAAGRDHAGDVWFDALDVAAPASAAAARLTSNATVAALGAARRHAQHKGSFGDVIVVGGAPGMIGAAKLAAHAALAAGAGRTLVSLLDPAAPLEDATRPEWLWCRQAWLPGHADLEHATVVCGCGGGTAVRAALPALLSRSARLVLDADALNAVATDAQLSAMLKARAVRGRATVLTPHPLEAARLLAVTTTEVQSDRLRAARSLVERFEATVLLKGSGSVIAGPRQIPFVNSSGNAALASGGTGDVLAGWIGGEWAQARAVWPDDADPSLALHCAAASAWCHGAAAEAQAGGMAMRARDLVDTMRAVRSAS